MEEEQFPKWMEKGLLSMKKITKAEDEWGEWVRGKKGKSVVLQVAELKIKIADNLNKALDWSQIL